jgi:hypothetical protein
MNEITIAQNHEDAKRTPVRLLDYDDEFQALGRIQSEFRQLLIVQNEPPLGQLRRVYAAAQELTSRTDFAAVAADLQARTRPATRQEASRHLALLVGSFPTGTPGDFKIFGRFLLEEVLACSPTVGGLIQACSNVRRTSRFVPKIAEVISALKEEEVKLRDRLGRVQRLPGDLQKAQDRIAELTERERALEAERLKPQLPPGLLLRKLKLYRTLKELGLDDAAARLRESDVLGDAVDPGVFTLDDSECLSGTDASGRQITGGGES